MKQSQDKSAEVLFLRLRATLHTLPLFYLRTQIYARTHVKNYARVEINP